MRIVRLTLVVACFVSGPRAMAKPASRPASMPSAAQTDAEVEALYKRVCNGVVRVKTHVGMGSGALVGAKTVVTNYHVIRDGRTIDVLTADGQSVRAHVHAVDRNNDLALLTLPRPLRGMQPLTVARTVHRGMRAMLVGFPLHPLARGHAHFGPLTKPSWVIAPITNTSTEGVQLTAGLGPGSSGGPIVDRAGQIVAIASRGVSGFAFGAPPAPIRKLLAAKHTGYERSVDGHLQVGYATVISAQSDLDVQHGLRLQASLQWDEWVVAAMLVVAGTRGPLDAFAGGTLSTSTHDETSGLMFGYRVPIPLWRYRSQLEFALTAGAAIRRRTTSERALDVASAKVVEQENDAKHVVFPFELTLLTSFPVLPVDPWFQIAYWLDAEEPSESMLALSVSLRLD